MIEFQEFGKIARLKREIVITEKIDGTNAQVAILPVPVYEGLHITDPETDRLCLGTLDVPGGGIHGIFAGSRNRWITPENDNFGFARWVKEHAAELGALGPGRHYGEWWGAGIQRRYGLTEKRFSLFNVHRWGDDRPECCHVVPLLLRGGEDASVDDAMQYLRDEGSAAAPGFMQPEGVVVFHSASRQLYKVTFENDSGKWSATK